MAVSFTRLEEDGLVEPDGRIPVVSNDVCPEAIINDCDDRRSRKNFINRYLITRPLGYALLVGSDSYHESDDAPLQCVKKDLSIMENVLKEGGWTVQSCGHNTDRDKVAEKIRTLKERENLDQYSCFMFYYSGHGSKDGMLLQPEKSVYQYKDMIAQLVELLPGKPKIIIFDCCRTDCQGTREEKRTVSQLLKEIQYNDTIVCYACASNKASISLGAEGSIFTQNLARKLEMFSTQLSFVDLLSQAMGETYHMSVARFGEKMAARPDACFGLYCQLVLKETSLSKSDLDRALTKRDHNIVLVPVRGSGDEGGARGGRGGEGGRERGGGRSELNELPEVGGDSIHSAPVAEQAAACQVLSPPPEPVMKDYVTTVRGKEKLKFTSREDVITRRFSLGQGHHVFLCYLPDPASPYDPPEISRVQKNINLVSLLSHDLTRHGFAVISDLSLSDTQPPRSLLQWYIWHIEHCDHVILVCSPSLKELFSATQPAREVADERAKRFLVYSSAIYSECERSLRNGMGKFIPVVLQYECQNFDLSVPILFRGSHVYELYESPPRLFDYNNTSNDFERMVCRMVGINRTQMNAPKPGAPLIINPDSVERANRAKYLAQAALPRPGYVTVQSKLSRGGPQQQGSTTRQEEREDAWAGVSLTQSQSSMSYNTTSTYSSSSSSYQPYQSTVIGVTGGSDSFTTTSMSTTTNMSVPPADGDVAPPHDQRHYVAHNYTYYQPSSSSINSSSAPPPHLQDPPLPPAPAVTLEPSSILPNSHLPPAPTVTQDPTLVLPLSPPPQHLLLWLCDRVITWRFLGRYLDLNESTLDRIARDNPLDSREQCYQMLNTFSMQGGSEATCRKLGRAILDSEKNKHLFDQFCEQVLG